MKRYAWIAMAAAVVLWLSAPAWADVTVKADGSGKGMGIGGTMTSVTYIKGAKMRTETQVGNGDTLVSIIDLDSQKMISLNTKKKEAEIFDIAKITADLQKGVGAGEPKVSFTPNGQTKEIMGTSCAGYDVHIAIPSSMGGNETMLVVLSGPAWLAKGAPGTADYAGFYRAAIANGFFYTNPQTAKAQPAQAKGMAEMYRAVVAAGGMVYGQEMTIRFEGGPLAGMMNKMGAISISTTTTEVTTGALDAGLFSVPADYKSKVK